MTVVAVVVLVSGNSRLGLVACGWIEPHVTYPNGTIAWLVGLWRDFANGCWSSVSSCGLVFLAWK